MELITSSRVTLAAMLLNPEFVVGIDVQSTAVETGAVEKDGVSWGTCEVKDRSVTLRFTRAPSGG